MTATQKARRRIETITPDFNRLLSMWTQLAIILLVVSAAVSPGDTARSCGSNPVDVTSIKEGFCIFEFAEIASARGIDLMPNGDMLVLSRSNPAQIVALYEDSQGSSTTVVLASLAGLTHAVKYKDGYVYASSDTAVYRWQYNGRSAMTNREVVISGIPAGGHSTRTIEFGKEDDWMYVSVGSGSNVDSDSSRARVVRHPLNESTVLPIAWSSMSVFADGLRNEVGLRMDPFNRLWGVENGMDNLARFTTSPPLYVTNPAEEVNIFTQQNAGKHYGYPYCWTEGIGEGGNTKSFPGGLGNGTIWATSGTDNTHTDEWCRTNTLPVAWAMQAHSAPLDIFFDNSSTFESDPVATITLHGSWNRPSNDKGGYRVDYLKLDSQYNILGSEVLVQFPVPTPKIRPVAMTRGSCRSYGTCLFVTDDLGGRVLAIVDESKVTPSADAPAPPAPPPFAGSVIKVNQHLTVEWAVQDDILTTSVVNSGALGWFSFGWSSAQLMSGSVLLSMDGQTTSFVDVTVRDADTILSTWNSQSADCGYTEIFSDIRNNAQHLSFKRPLRAPGSTGLCSDIPYDGISTTNLIFAWHYTDVGNLENSFLPKHSATASLTVVLGATHPGSSADRSVPHVLLFAFVLVVALIGIF